MASMDRKQRKALVRKAQVAADPTIRLNTCSTCHGSNPTVGDEKPPVRCAVCGCKLVSLSDQLKSTTSFHSWTVPT